MHFSAATFESKSPISGYHDLKAQMMSNFFVVDERRHYFSDILIDYCLILTPQRFKASG
jgi:hypothetical protein